MTPNCVTMPMWSLSLIWQAYHKVAKAVFPVHICRSNENTSEI